MVEGSFLDGHGDGVRAEGAVEVVEVVGGMGELVEVSFDCVEVAAGDGSGEGVFGAEGFDVFVGGFDEDFEGGPGGISVDAGLFGKGESGIHEGDEIVAGHDGGGMIEGFSFFVDTVGLHADDTGQLFQGGNGFIVAFIKTPGALYHTDGGIHGGKGL